MNSGNLINLNNIELTRFLSAVMLLLVSAHLFAYILQLLKLPRVIGEIIGGIILGPSLLGFMYPNVYDWVFNAFESEGKLISSIYWFGLMLLMFVSGFEIEWSFNKKDKNIISVVLLGSTIVPFLAGWILPDYYNISPLLGVKQNILALKIIVAIAIAVTSIPVISKIFIDLNIIKTRFAKIVLTAATIHDIILWIALAIATELVNNGVSTINILYSLLITLVFFIFTLLFAPKIFNYITNNKLNPLVKSSDEGYALFICLLFTVVASILNVNIVFGAFLAGVVLNSLLNEKFKRVKTNIKSFSLAFFIPIYFAVVGLKIDLIYHFNILFFLMFFLFTTFFEMAGTFFAVKLIRIDNLSSFNFSVAMTTRGGPGIVLATIAYDTGIISETFFVTLVVIAIITSLLAGYWFRVILSKGWPLLSAASPGKIMDGI